MQLLVSIIIILICTKNANEPTFLFLVFPRYSHLEGLHGHMSLVTPWWYRVPPVHPPSSRRGGSSSTHSTRTGMTFSGWVYIDYLAIFQASASSKLGGSRHPPPPSQVVVHCRILEQTDASLFQAVTLLLSVGYSPAMTPPLPPDPVGQGDQPIHNSRHASWERRSSSVGFPCSWCTKCCFTATYWKYRYLQQC